MDKHLLTDMSETVICISITCSVNLYVCVCLDTLNIFFYNNSWCICLYLDDYDVSGWVSKGHVGQQAMGWLMGAHFTELTPIQCLGWFPTDISGTGTARSMRWHDNNRPWLFHHPLNSRLVRATGLIGVNKGIYTN